MKKNQIILIIVVTLIIIVFIIGIYWLPRTIVKRTIVKNKISQEEILQNTPLIMQEFIKENLPEVIQPQSLDVKQTTDQTGRTFYAANWTANNLDFNTSLFYNNSGNPNLILLSIPMPGNIGNFNETAALSFAQEYFKKVGENWKCKKENIAEVCESSWMDGKDKKYVGVQNILPVGRHILYSCKIPFGSDNYNQSWCMPVK